MNQRKQVDVVALPLAICTITIDGKRLSPSLFKQIARESLIDEESGEFRGVPIGWLNVHQKECPEFSHLHVLWMRGHALRLATVYGPTASERYHEKKQQSLHLRQRLTDLLAYVLAGEFRYEPSAYLNEEQVKFKIGTYTLPVTNYAGRLLDALEQARRCSEQEDAACRDDTSDLASKLEAARQLQERLVEQNISLAHPALDNHRHDRISIYSSYYEDDDDDDDSGFGISYGPIRQGPKTPPIRPKRGKWFVYTPPDRPSSGESDQLLWSAKTSITEEEAIQAVEQQFAEHVPVIRALLAQQVVQQDEQAIRERIEELTKEFQETLVKSASTKRAKAKTPPAPPLPPKDIFARYQQEADQFDAYTERWQRAVASLEDLEQLFIVS